MPLYLRCRAEHFHDDHAARRFTERHGSHTRLLLRSSRAWPEAANCDLDFDLLFFANKA